MQEKIVVLKDRMGKTSLFDDVSYRRGQFTDNLGEVFESGKRQVFLIMVRTIPTITSVSVSMIA
jgi:hypothetical protein